MATSKEGKNGSGKNVLLNGVTKGVSEEENDAGPTGKLPSVWMLAEELVNHSRALSALGMLLETSSLEFFSDEGLGLVTPTRNEHAANLRWGLNKIIDMYIEKQERIVAEFQEEFEQSDYVILKNAECVVEACNKRWWGMFDHTGRKNPPRWGGEGRGTPYDALTSAIGDLDSLIAKSPEFKDRAKTAKGQALVALDYLEKQSGQNKNVER